MEVTNMKKIYIAEMESISGKTVFNCDLCVAMGFDVDTVTTEAGRYYRHLTKGERADLRIRIDEMEYDGDEDMDVDEDLILWEAGAYNIGYVPADESSDD